MSDKVMDHVVKKPDIIGSTTINHAARIELGLNCSEYVLMSYIVNCVKNNKPLESIETYIKTGFSEEESLAIVRGLIQKGFVMLRDSPIPDITSKWESAFANIEDEFENLFWKKDGKVVWIGSSRKMSLSFYIKARKRYAKDILITNRDQYLEYLDLEHMRGFNRQIMGCEKYLNEKNEYYLVDWKTMSEGIKKQLSPQTENKPVEPLTKESRKEMYNE